MTETSIPEGWQKVALGKFMEIKNGINADKSAYGQGTKFVNAMGAERENCLDYHRINDIILFNLLNKTFLSMRVDTG